MSTTETVRAWSTTAASNATADSAITSSDNQRPDTLDNNVRSVMAASKKQQDDTGGALTAGGTANALTVTTGQVLESGQLTAGLRLLVRATADNTSATVTFAPDGLTAANIKRTDGSALAIGSIRSGMGLDLIYNTGSSEWRCLDIPSVAGFGGLAAFKANKGGSNQAVAVSTFTLVTFATEAFDVGPYFATNTWTPPAGLVELSTAVALLTDFDRLGFTISITKNGSVINSCLNGVSALQGAVTTMDVCNGTDGYQVVIQTAGDASYTIDGATASTWFMGRVL